MTWLRWTALGATLLVSAGTTPRSSACDADHTAVLLHWAHGQKQLQPRWSGCFDLAPQQTPKPALITRIQVRGVAAFELRAAGRKRP